MTEQQMKKALSVLTKIADSLDTIATAIEDEDSVLNSNLNRIAESLEIVASTVDEEENEFNVYVRGDFEEDDEDEEEEEEA